MAKNRSAHPDIDKGYYHGLYKDVSVRAGCSVPCAITAIQNNDISSPKKFKAVQAALEIIRERELQLA